MTAGVKKTLGSVYFIVLALLGLGYTVFVSLQKPTSSIKQVIGLEGELQQNLEQFSHAEEHENRINVFESPEADFTLTVIAQGDETGILDGICNRFMQGLDSLSEEKVRVYMVNIKDSAKLSGMAVLTEKLQSDACLILTLGTDEDAKRYGIKGCVNGSFYWEKLPEADLCDAFVRNVAISTQNRGDAEFNLDVEDDLWEYNVPSARLVVGYVTNESENSLLLREDYRNKVAEGLLNGIKEIYKKTHEE